MEKIRVALIGAGYISDYHARGLGTLPNVEIVAVVSKQLDNAKKFASKYNIKNAYGTILDVVKDSTIDAAIISTPNVYHVPYAIQFLENGKDVFIEKPMAMNAKEGTRLQKVAAKTGNLIMVGHMWRFDVEAQYVKKNIASGKIGKVIKTKSYGIHENWGPQGWFTQNDLAGGGALADMGVHAIDTIRYLLGDPRPVKVYARIATHFGDYNVDDSGIIMITWDSGTESIIESGWWQPHMDGPEASSGIYGTKGYASLFPTFLKLKKGESSEQITPNLPAREDHCDQVIYTKQMEYFIDCVRTRTVPIPGTMEGQIVMQIVDAAYRSAQTGKVIDL